MANGKWKYKDGIAPIFNLKTEYKGAMGYVTQADSDLISIKVFGIPVAQKLMIDGFKLSDDNEMVLNVSSEVEKAQLFNKLRSYDLAFASGKEWSPSEVFEYLVGQGHLSPGYKKNHMDRSEYLQNYGCYLVILSLYIVLSTCPRHSSSPKNHHFSEKCKGTAIYFQKYLTFL